ncbi:hypothetical protein C5167_044649 [Papaver somniferum]|uniref:PGG domain-containing protein n=1 Tax=Papaver somniferum TaxID=3469 RepID=A0A4Y7LBP9_PAPSO|nr:ankyrin repeat-containing protein At5g02620-like isoform X2 [Papaver somniferum]RZC82070.1 hypothetical protein C5167_044649 [Papaver somniferum]
MAETDLSEVVIGDEPLTSSNYENWKVYMQNYLSNLNIWGIVNGTESEPDEANEYKTWMTRNEMVLSAIKTSCGPEMVTHLHGIDSAKEAWDRLASIQSSEANVAGSIEETGVVLEIQHEDDDDAEPKTKVFTRWQSPKRSVSSNSSFGEQMSPLALSDEDTSDPASEDSEVGESFAESVTRFRPVYKALADDKPDYIRFRPLYKALAKGDWRTAKEIIEDHPEGLSARITSRGDTALHAAVVSGKLSTVKALLKLLPPEALEAKNSSGDTAIALSAADGTTKIAKLLVKKNKWVLRIKNQYGFIPLVMSILYEKEDMFYYIYSVTPMDELDPDKSKNGASFLLGAINSEMFDVALEVLEFYPKLAICKDRFGIPAIYLLAVKSYMFPSGSRFGFWQRCMYSSCAALDERQRTRKFGTGESVIALKRLGSLRLSTASRSGRWPQNIYSSCVKDLLEKRRKHVQVLELLKVICSAIGHMTDEELKNGKVYDTMLAAATNGNIEVFMELFDANPSLLYTSTTVSRKTLYHQAVMSRQENIFNFISSMGQRDIRATHKDNSDNNLLHYAAMLPLSSMLDKISGAALQMQREIQWFQEVEKIVQPKYKESLNKDGKTPAEVFTEQHKALKKDGEVWMKETANACMLVSALIATVMFAAAFTVPGGNEQSTGTPFFLKTPAFTIFIVSDAISLFASCSSILMFFSILTARYAEQDFLKSLPQRLVIGLASLFISIAAMMAAFGATLVIVLRSSITWAFIPVTLLASVPVVLFGLLLFPLFLDIVRSTYGAGIFTWQKVYLNNKE